MADSYQDFVLTDNRKNNLTEHLFKLKIAAVTEAEGEPRDYLYNTFCLL